MIQFLNPGNLAKGGEAAFAKSEAFRFASRLIKSAMRALCGKPDVSQAEPIFNTVRDDLLSRLAVDNPIEPGKVLAAELARSTASDQLLSSSRRPTYYV
ncbi:MAG TPA: hypothetical protein VMX33_08040 [bacterium]|nr:hypothetical protein [bacterium]